MKNKPWAKDAHKKLVESCLIKYKEDSVNGKNNINSLNSKDKPAKKNNNKT